MFFILEATMKKIVCEATISTLLQRKREDPKAKRLAIINQAKNKQGLSLEESASLLHIKNADELAALYAAASEIKQAIYGNRVVMFAPLYTSNECTNNCLYCGFRVENQELVRKTLTIEEIVAEANEMVRQGHKRLLLVCGEDQKQSPLQHTIDVIGAIYQQTGIRRINVNAAPMSVESFKELKKANIGTYQIFQETYHRETYQRMHQVGLKSDYDYRLTAIDRALEAGIDDFGIGALLGLYDYKFEVLATLMHANYLDTIYGIGPHTVSVPRLKEAPGSALKEVPYKVTDEEMKKIVAIYRLALPYTGIILSTREATTLRDELLEVGVSQLSAGSKTNPGGYDHQTKNANQFEISDERTLEEMIATICEKGYLPSFCTACYRGGRTGERFMKLAKTGDIHKLCQPNSIMTFQENIEDFAPAPLKANYQNIIAREIAKIEDKKIKELTQDRVKKIQNGERDLYL